MSESQSTARREVLNRGGWGNGDVYRVRQQGRLVVVKTYAGKPLVIRWIGRFLLGREKRAYERLRGLPGIPRVLEWPEPLSLALENIEGERISNQALASERGQGIVASLRSLVDAMHARGVFHLDLRNQGNVMVDHSNRAWLLDFASCVMLRRPDGWLSPVARLCRRIDLYGVSKWAGRASVERQG
ncbi:MAG: hypothetical protein QNJ40_26090 [Xanthomonadales bacterium]|nr:hypothetical protein [Xanthomonadales bacterium]